jgi:hypothetical protein
MASEHAARDEMAGRPDAGAVVLSELRGAAERALAALDDLDGPVARREGVRTARRELKAVRALAPLCRGRSAGEPAETAVDGILEFSAKANQLLGPVRDRDALARSIQRITERFADAESRRVARTVLLATLVFAEADRRDDAQFATAAIERARRAIRQANDVLAAWRPRGGIDREGATRIVAAAFSECRVELAEALETADLLRLHECRKRASFLALALRPFGDGVPARARRLRSRARRLAAALGEDRDFALLDVEMRMARARLAGSPLVSAIDDALRLARLEATARMEDAARDFLRLGSRATLRALDELFDS